MVRSGPSLGRGEETLVSAHAVHKKIVGMVWFTTRRAVWLATDAKAAVQRVEVTWAAVKSFQVSGRVLPALLRCEALRRDSTTTSRILQASLWRGLVTRTLQALDMGKRLPS